MLTEESRKVSKVLMVDDEAKVLAGYKRHLKKIYDLTITTDPIEGLELCVNKGPFAVIVSDQRMPEMDGVTFLTEIRKLVPNTVRIMLSGQADMEETIKAVNHGNIFRFLNKPCKLQDLVVALDDGIKQFNLLESEKVLLDQTLRSSLEVLVEVLSLVNPYAYGCSSRMYRIVKKIAKKLRFEKSWELEIASLMAHVGLVTIPANILSKVVKGRELTGEEDKTFMGYPKASYNLLKSIPRLELVCSFVRDLHSTYDSSEFEEAKGTEKEEILLGTHILNLAMDFDKEVFGKQQTEVAGLMSIMKVADEGKYNPIVVKALKGIIVPSSSPLEISSIDDLILEMLTAKPVVDNMENEILPVNYTITSVALKLLENFVKTGAVKFPIFVWDRDEN